jgi:hypothetical protein
MRGGSFAWPSYVLCCRQIVHEQFGRVSFLLVTFAPLSQKCREWNARQCPATLAPKIFTITLVGLRPFKPLK